MEIKVTAKKWGSSLGVVLPKEIVEAKRIKENKEIIIEVKDVRPKAGELFGLLKGWEKSGQEIKDEMRKGWESESDKERMKKWKK
ncbi:AbrB/MazE/SpoVT family DNA-binding domain-containing protein [Candidatus Pacearchaeota archaeon]|nr:AbrB/MazE/SpoVT family DNA-binding domain-containing protein [Candidatus Pacearchaeota archaeon]